MSRTLRITVVIAASIFAPTIVWVCSSVVDFRFQSSVFAQEPNTASTPPGESAVNSGNQQESEQADSLFAQQKWAEARKAYDKFLPKKEDQWLLPETVQNFRRAIACSIRLGEWNDALLRVSTFRAKRQDDPQTYYLDDPDERAQWQAEVHHVGVARELLSKIADDASRAADDKVRTQVANARVALNFELVALLDPDHRPIDEEDAWSEDVSWWWDGIPGAEAYVPKFDDDGQQVAATGIPTAANGKPVFVASPATYSDSLARSAKLLFLLNEIEQVDPSPDRHRAVDALLHRADLACRLYGPWNDPDWNYPFYLGAKSEEPQSVLKAAAEKLKPVTDLSDDEVRMEVGRNLSVLKLPPAENPLELWSRIERDFPNCNRVSDAVYLRAYYFQNRHQFDRAKAEYARMIAAFPQARLVDTARRQIAHIDASEVSLKPTGPFIPGERPQFQYGFRNTDRVDFAVRKFDFKGYLAERKKAPWSTVDDIAAELFARPKDSKHPDAANVATPQVAKHVGVEVAHWTQTVSRSRAVAVLSTSAPVLEIGTYIIEARTADESSVSRGLVVVTDAALVVQNLPGKSLVWAVDSRTGKARKKQSLEYLFGAEKKGPGWSEQTETDDRGIAVFQRKREVSAWLDTPSGGIAFAELKPGYSMDRVKDFLICCGVTDRPVYRPGSTVNFRLWFREMAGHKYRPAKAGVAAHISVCMSNEMDDGSHGDPEVASFDLTTDESGSVVASFSLDPNSQLGEYYIVASVEGSNARQLPQVRALSFRVEEYKKPEFQVEVTPSTKAVKTGEPITAVISARYYFGGPVAGGQVKYSVLRKQHREEFSISDEWDWLYGKADDDQYIDSSETFYRYENLELEPVSDGTARLDKDGRFELKLDTTATGQQVAEYVINASVQDESRRTIESSGTVVAANREFRALVRLDRGWYEPATHATLDLYTRSASDSPVAISGRLTLARVSTDATVEQGAPAKPATIATWNAATGADGHFSLPFDVPPEGQYQVTFESHDSRNEPVVVSADLWVLGPKFDGDRCRIDQSLQIIPDRRHYRPGETVKLLVVAKQPETSVLLYEMDRQSVIDVMNHSKVVAIPIRDEHTILFEVGATLVDAGQTHTKLRRIFIPPVNENVALTIKTERETYRPGDVAKLQIKATDAEGKPVRGSMALSVFDKSLTYIQSESTDTPRDFLYAKLQTWRTPDIDSSLGAKRFHASGHFVFPEIHFDGRESVWGSYRPAWFGGGPSYARGGFSAGGGFGVGGGGAMFGGGGGGLGQGVGGFFGGGGGFRAPTPRNVQPEIRENFADTAAWIPKIELNENGEARTEVRLPESLTTWRIRGDLVTPETRVGEAAASVVTSKNLLVRLQSPRFLVESDNVVLSANVHNSLSKSKEVTAELIVPAGIFEFAGDANGTSRTENGELHLLSTATVEPSSEKRFDWQLKVRVDGTAMITVKALTDEESDATRLVVPVQGRGIAESKSLAGFVPRNVPNEKVQEFELPTDFDPRSLQIDLSLSPTAAATAFDALPFLASYPYGCVEQTMSRFYPTVLASNTLRDLDINIETIAKKLKAERQATRYREHPLPVFDTAELKRMTDAGLNRLYQFQHPDGGWGWWENDSSSSYMTAYVLVGLDVAAQAGVEVRPGALDRAAEYLMKAIRDPNAAARETDFQERRALAAYALSVGSYGNIDRKDLDNLIDVVLAERGQLSPYGQALLVLALHERSNEPETLSQWKSARQVLEEILKKVEIDAKRSTASVAGTQQEKNWRWYHSPIETNACILRAMLAVDPKNELIHGFANWLVEHRRNGHYWESTRDTALAVHALAEYVVAFRETGSAFDVNVQFDDSPAQTVRVSWQNVLEQRGHITPVATEMKLGLHRVTLTRKETQPLHYSLVVRYVRKPERIPASGNGLQLMRRYFKVPRRAENSTATEPAANVLRQPMKDGESIAIGDEMEVELTIHSDSDYEYLAFDDPKPAGFEPIQLQSGYSWGNGLCSNVELRDASVVFFAPWLVKGTHVLRYKLRAEVPGDFRALPSVGFAMYNSDIRANSDEMRFQVRD